MMTNKEYNRMITRTQGGARNTAHDGAKSCAFEIYDHHDAEWRREWIRRGLGRVALSGPVGKLP